jgi:ABC-2 type transport system permease protein
MRWRTVRAIVRRDLTVVLGSRAVMLPALIVPAVLLVVLPVGAGLVPGLVGVTDVGDLAPLLELLPDTARATLPDDPGLQVAQVMVTHLLAPLVVLVPVMLVAVVAADGIAGEKERGTLEGLLLTPATDRELATAKLLAAWVPSVVIGVGGAVLYAVVGNLVVGVQVGRVILPTVEFALLALWVGPTFAAAALGVVLLVSLRVASTQEAFQVGGIVVLPVVGLVVTQATGALLLSPLLLVATGALAGLVALGVLRVAGRSLSRTRLGTRLG